MGPMLQRAGEIEQAAVLAWLQRIVQWLGSCLIVLLGGMIGLVMIALLIAVSGISAELVGWLSEIRPSCPAASALRGLVTTAPPAPEAQPAEARPRAEAPARAPAARG